jgi:hypothetical protein
MSEVNEIPLISYGDGPKPSNPHPSDKYLALGGYMHKRDYGRRFNEKRFRPHEVQDLLDAAAFAGRIGKPLNTAITVMYCLTAGGAADIRGRWRKFHNAFPQWLRRRGCTWTAVWQHENPPHKGFHTHLSIHLPDHMHAAAYDWLTRYFGGHPNAVDLRPGSLARYGLKGTDKMTAEFHGLFGDDGKWDWDQGIVDFKRGGCSSNINRTAREQFRWDFLANIARVREAPGVLEPIGGGAHADGP